MNQLFARVMHEEFDKLVNNCTPDEMWDGSIQSLRLPGSTKEHDMHEDTAYGGWQCNTDLHTMKRLSGIAPAADDDKITSTLTTEGAAYASGGSMRADQHMQPRVHNAMVHALMCKVAAQMDPKAKMRGAMRWNADTRMVTDWCTMQKRPTPHHQAQTGTAACTTSMQRVLETCTECTCTRGARARDARGTCARDRRVASRHYRCKRQYMHGGTTAHRPI
eukprot:COSAG02_NODE_1862_length_10609_cov_36.585616_10_plen_220_part_00